MFGFFAGFLAGTGFGIYVAQKYEIPDIRDFMENFKEASKKYEKKNENDKTSWQVSSSTRHQPLSQFEWYNVHNAIGKTLYWIALGFTGSQSCMVANDLYVCWRLKYWRPCLLFFFAIFQL